MSEESRTHDPGSAWRAQPEEKNAMNIEQIVSRRTAEMHARTRSEIWASIGAAVFFVSVLALRLYPSPGRSGEVGVAAILAWIVITLFWFRHRLQRRDSSRADAVADPGLEYYRKELEQRRDHLRNVWLWNGPLFLSCLVLLAVLAGKWFAGWERLPSVLPLLVLLVAWSIYGYWRRRRQAAELQREIEEIGSRGGSGTTK